VATLVYCEICGVLIKGPQSHAPIPEGVICDTCFESRRAVVTTTEPAAPESGAMVQFNCCYCHSLLRLKAVAKRTRIKCPKCADAFYLNPDGRLESRLEGNTTAVISADQVLRPLTPTEGFVPVPQAGGASKTQPIHRDETPALSKTQPMSRDQLLPPPGKQQALLDELKPKKLAFLDNVPARDPTEARAAMVDTDSFEGRNLDLLPDDVGPGDAPKAPKVGSALRPSEEGKVDLDADGLRRKTAKYQQKQLLGKHTTKRRKQAEPDDAPDRAEDEGKRERAKEREKDKAKDEQKREERDRRAAEAQRKAQELEAQQSKRSLGAISLTALCVLPAIVALLLLTMTTRGTGFATRGAFGERMKDVGQGVDRGVRSLGGMVNPYLPPEYRLPQVAPR
jgi:hypothetical protein